MQVSLPIVDGYLPDKYGKYAPDEFKYDGHPSLSFPISITNVPEDTMSLALVMLDDDAIPVSGFSWIHWTAANIPADVIEIPENASLFGTFDMIQGKNSTAGGMVGSTDPLQNARYNGPQPPNQDHVYSLYVYALDSYLPLEDGYWLNEFYHASEGRIIEQVKVDFLSQS